MAAEVKGGGLAKAAACVGFFEVHLPEEDLVLFVSCRGYTASRVFF